MYELVKKWRIDAKLTQKEVAERLFMTPQAVSLIEQGKRNLTFPLMEQIAEAFDKELLFHVQDKMQLKELNEEIIKRELVSDGGLNVLIGLVEEDIANVLVGKSYFAKSTAPHVEGAVEKACLLFKGDKGIEQATGAVLMVEGGIHFTYDDLDYASKYLHERLRENVDIVVGVVVNEQLSTDIIVRIALAYDAVPVSSSRLYSSIM